MSDLSISKHYQRVLRFLISLSDERVAALLAVRGFDRADAERGWQLFLTSAGRDISCDRRFGFNASPSKKLLEALDQWENISFDIADATLKGNYPDLHKKVFLNLGKTSGQAVVISVTTLLNRLDELAQQGGEENEAALALLAKRGLSTAHCDEARDLLAQIADLAPVAATPEQPSEQERRREAEQAMWAWFMEWATLARTVVTSKRLRMHMGVSKATSTADADTDTDTDIDTDTEAKPSAPQPGGPDLGVTPSPAPAPAPYPAPTPNVGGSGSGGGSVDIPN